MPDQPIEDVLASIRRLMLEEPAPAPAEAPPADAPDAPHQPAAEADDVLELTQPLPPEPVRAAPRPLVSADTAEASRQALAYLSALRLKGGEPGDDTLAGMVRDMLKPMLKAWLDAELPAIVERLVVQELARLEVGREQGRPA